MAGSPFSLVALLKALVMLRDGKHAFACLWIEYCTGWFIRWAPWPSPITKGKVLIGPVTSHSNGGLGWAVVQKVAGIRAQRMVCMLTGSGRADFP